MTIRAKKRSRKTESVDSVYDQTQQTISVANPIETAMDAVASVFGKRSANMMLQQALLMRISERPNTRQLVEIAGKRLLATLKRYRTAFSYAVVKNRKTGKTVDTAMSVLDELIKTL